MPGRLILCATPIGNLGDASLRLAEALSSADVVYAEDTRRSRVLLQALDVSTPLRSLFVGNERERTVELGSRLAAGETVAVITDAGMPGVSDPGVLAIREARAAGAVVSVVPGPSAVTAAVAISGFGADRFVFEGFLPRRGRSRREVLKALASETRTAVLFVSPHRLVADLAAMVESLGEEREVCVVRELTKLHEEVWWGSLSDAQTEWTQRAPQGEFTLVVAGAKAKAPELEDALRMARGSMADGRSRSEAAKLAAAETGIPKREIYDGLDEL